MKYKENILKKEKKNMVDKDESGRQLKYNFNYIK